MGIDGIGSSVIIALAAVMWFLYLIPTWLKRREYLATERNAVRLQQTMRILAESAEVPSVVRVEATARTVAAQQRALRQQQRQSNSRSMRPTVSLPDEAQRAMDAGARTRLRLRRSRALASLVLLASVIGMGFGLPAAIAGNWLILVLSVAVGAGSISLLNQAATVTHARADLRRVAMAAVSPRMLHDEADYAPERRVTGWTPVPVPKPLYLSESAPAAVSARSHVNAQTRASEGSRSDRDLLSVEGSRDDGNFLSVEGSRSDRLETAKFDHAAALRAASAEAERALRAAQASPEVARISRPAAERVVPVAVPSRFASMGVLDPSASSATDLDEILRRRRAAG